MAPKKTKTTTKPKKAPSAYAKFTKDYWAKNRAALKAMPFAEAAKEVAAAYAKSKASNK